MGTLIYIVTMGWALIIHGGITYLFWKKQDYSLLNGFANRPDEEKEYLEKSGYLTALTKLLATTFWLFFATFILGLLPVPFGFEIAITVFILVLMIGLVWIQRYEVSHKRKKMLWIMGIISAVTLLSIGLITSIGYMNNNVNIHENTFEITGMYGIEWDLANIETVELLDELPNVLFRSNGFSTSGILKGRFQLEDPYGNGLLFINERSGPYLYVAIDEDFVIVSRKDPVETQRIYEELLKKF